MIFIKKNIVMVGMTGVGKTTIGKVLSKKLKWNNIYCWETQLKDILNKFNLEQYGMTYNNNIGDDKASRHVIYSHLKPLFV